MVQHAFGALYSTNDSVASSSRDVIRNKRSFEGFEEPSAVVIESTTLNENLMETEATVPALTESKRTRSDLSPGKELKRFKIFVHAVWDRGVELSIHFSRIWIRFFFCFLSDIRVSHLCLNFGYLLFF